MQLSVQKTGCEMILQTRKWGRGMHTRTQAVCRCEPVDSGTGAHWRTQGRRRNSGALWSKGRPCRS